MNILFVLYGDFGSNSANPLVLYARELSQRGHSCAIAVPSNLETVGRHDKPAFRPLLYTDVLAHPSSVFSDSRPADVIHACTPREVVRRFITLYMAKQPTPLVLYLEDHEHWIATRTLGLDEEMLVRHTEQEISEMTPLFLAHPFYSDSFIGMADAVAVIQDKLKSLVPPWVYCKTVMIGVDLDFFSPRPPDPILRNRYGLMESEKVLVYHGVVHDFTWPGIRTLCEAVGIINQQGFRCRLLRTGPYSLEDLGKLPPQCTPFICDLGLLPKPELPGLLALADVCVQPGETNPFEDLRLPGKIPEWLAMGRPVVMPDANISHIFQDGENAIFLQKGSPEEIAEKCIDLFSHPQRANEIGRAGRTFAVKNFDVRHQAAGLEEVYFTACKNFSPAISAVVWQTQADDYSPVLRLASKLNLVGKERGKNDPDYGKLLQEYGKLVENMCQRLEAVESRLRESLRGKEIIKILIARFFAFPLRLFSKLLRKVFGFGDSDDWLRIGLEKGIKIYRREGWAGLRFRLQRKIRKI